MVLLWILGASFIATMFAALTSNYDAPLAAGLMVGTTFYLIGFTGLVLQQALNMLKGRAVAKSFFAGLAGVMAVLGSISVASSLMITALKVYAKYWS